MCTHRHTHTLQPTECSMGMAYGVHFLQTHLGLCGISQPHLSEFCSHSLLQDEKGASLFKMAYTFALVLCSCPDGHSEGVVGFRVSDLIKS